MVETTNTTQGTAGEPTCRVVEMVDEIYHNLNCHFQGGRNDFHFPDPMQALTYSFMDDVPILTILRQGISQPTTFMMTKPHHQLTCTTINLMVNPGKYKSYIYIYIHIFVYIHNVYIYIHNIIYKIYIYIYTMFKQFMTMIELRYAYR